MQTGSMTFFRRLAHPPTLHILGLLSVDLIIGINLFNPNDGLRFLATFGSIGVLLYLMERRALYHRLSLLLFSLGVYGLTLGMVIAGGLAGFYALAALVVGNHVCQIVNDPVFAWPYWLTGLLVALALFYDHQNNHKQSAAPGS